MPRRIRIMPFDWSEFVRSHVFEQVLISAAGVPITYLLVSGSKAQPGWLALNPALSILCFAFAFLRVWKSLMEEVETSDAQEIIEYHLDETRRKLDLIILPFYVFSLFLMPFFSVAFQLFVCILLLFYIIDFGYNVIYVKALPEYYRALSYDPAEIKQCPVRGYFLRRRNLDLACLVFIFVFGAVSWWLALARKTNGALAAGFICVILLLVIEGLIEPMVNVDFHYYEEKSPPDGDGI
jgi:hypothetical protein